MRILLAIAFMLTAANVQAQCPNGRCPRNLHAGQPVRNAVKAPVIVAAKAVKAAVVIPAKAIKGCAHVVREVRPVRRVLRGAFRVATFRGPILTRMRHARCH